MLANEWDDVKGIFEQAVKLTSTARAQLLDSLCDGKPLIRQAVEMLLTAHDQSAGFLEDEATTQLTPVFQPGDVVAHRFRIVRFMSRGGMGEVYEAYDERLSQSIALKTLRSEFARDRDALERFRREIRISREFGHPNLCRVFELVEDRSETDAQASVTCLTMQLIEGETLQQHLAKRGPMKPEEALPLLGQIAEAVDFLHSKGIVHRDLKPSNVMITRARNGEPLAIVMDFGLAKPFHLETGLFDSGKDFQAGAPYFMAPELLRGEKPTAASDIYAFGLIIDEMVTSPRTHEGESGQSSTEPMDSLAHSPALPAAWSGAILRCLHRYQDRRYASAREVVANLHLPVTAEERKLSAADRVRRFLRAARPSAFRFPGIKSKLLAWTVVCLMLIGGLVLALIRPAPLTTSVLVFPIENWTGKADYEYFCKGTTSELVRRLVELPGLDVIPYYELHSTVPSFTPTTRFSVEGSLQSFANFARLSVKVTENPGGRVVWMTNFDKSLSDPLEVQGEATWEAAEAMRNRIKLSSDAGFVAPVTAVVRRLFSPYLGGQSGGPTVNSAAMDAYMRGRFQSQDGSVPALIRATAELRNALREDPHFSLAYSELSAVRLNMIQFGFTSRRKLLTEAEDYAQQAVKYGPGMAESHAALATVLQYQWDWAGAEREFQKAINANPKFARAHRWYGGFLLQFGKSEEALREVRTSIRLDPYDQGRMDLGDYLMYAGRPKEAADYIESCLREKDVSDGHQRLAYIYAALGAQSHGSPRRAYLDRALRETDIVVSTESKANLSKEAGDSTPLLALIYGLRGDRARATGYLNKLLGSQQNDTADPADIASAYVALGDTNSALDVLSKAVDGKDNGLIYMKVSPFYAPIRNTPKFKALVERARL